MKKTILIILGIVMVMAIAGGGYYLWQIRGVKNISETPRSQPLQKNQQIIQNPVVIYGDIQSDKNDPRGIPNNIIFYSIDPATKKQTQLSTISADKVNVTNFDNYSGSTKFCQATNKIYVRGLGIDNTDYITEVDLNGNIRNLDFTKTTWSGGSIEADFVLSPDCQKIIWRTAVDEFAIANLDGSGKKILQKIDAPNLFDEKIISWSSVDPNIIYLTSNSNTGGLFKLDINTELISQIDTIPTSDIVWDVSSNDNLVTHQVNYLITNSVPSTSFVTNLTDKTKMQFENTSNGKRKFSPDSSKLANTLLTCTGIEASAKCVPSLYLFDLVKTNKLISPDAEFAGWLTNDSIIGIKDSKTLVLITTNNSTEKELASVPDSLLYIGIVNKEAIPTISNIDYKNNKYAYQLSYPSNVDLLVPGLISPQADSMSGDIAFVEKNKDDLEFLDLYILQNKGQLNLDSLIDNVAKKFSKKEDITINNQRAIKVSFISGTIDTKPYGLSGVSMLAENQDFIFIPVGENVMMFEIRNTEDKSLAQDIITSFKSGSISNDASGVKTSGISNTNNNTLNTSVAPNETDDLIKKISLLTALPSGETPSIATVTDQVSVRSQAGLENAENGDKVLIYTNAKRAFLYRPSTNQLINISTISF